MCLFFVKYHISKKTAALTDINFPVSNETPHKGEMMMGSGTMIC
jgi:hypothetical protein